MLLQHRSDDAMVLPGFWAFFGGGAGQKETPDEAVRREAREELNYKLKNPVFIHEQRFIEGKARGRIYVFIEHFKSAKSVLRLQEGQGMGWYNVEEMRSLKMASRDKKIIGIIARFLNHI